MDFVQVILVILGVGLASLGGFLEMVVAIAERSNYLEFSHPDLFARFVVVVCLGMGSGLILVALLVAVVKSSKVAG